MKIVELLNGLTIKVKLIGLAALAFLLIAGILLAGFINYAKISNASGFKDNISELNEDLLLARVAEKSYLQFYHENYISILHDLCSEANSKVVAFIASAYDLNQKAQLENIAEIINQYASTFDRLVAINQNKVLKTEAMEVAFNDVQNSINSIVSIIEELLLELTMEGEVLGETENMLLFCTRDCNTFVLTAESKLLNYALSGDDATFSAFEEYTTGDSALTINSLKASAKLAGDILDTNMLDLAKTLEKAIKEYLVMAADYHSEFVMELQEVTKLDRIGNNIKNVTTELTSGANLMAEEAKKSAVVIIGICLIVGGLIFLAITTFIILSITRPIAMISAAAERLQKGDLGTEITYTSTNEIGVLADAFRRTNQTLHDLVSDMQNVAGEAAHGQLDQRADTTKHQGAYGDLARGVNDIIDRLVQFIDSLPLPVLTMNTTYDILYMNQAGLETLETTKQKIAGQKVFNCLPTVDSQTPEWACARAIKSGKSESAASKITVAGKELDINYSVIPLTDPSGQVVGALEIVQDMTAIKIAARLANKQAVYQNNEVNRLVNFMESMAEGVLTNQLQVAASDGDTQDAHDNFMRIGDAVETLRKGLHDKASVADAIARGDLSKQVKLASDKDTLGKALQTMVKAIQQLVVDANTLAEAALKGQLQTRANTDVHQGDFQKVVTGINNTLEAIMIPINEVEGVLHAAADGNLTNQVTGDYDGQLKKLKDNVNATITSLEQALNEVQNVTHEVNNGSSQISDATQALSQGATQQAAALEEISSSMQEVAAQTKTNAENASQANRLTGEARDAAEIGSHHMEKMEEAINDINDSSQQIAKIIKVIDGIAFQTNLLALNAAVEAARAGIHGKGFAVVADEVRNLAGRSAKAAHETADLIESSGSKVANGLRVAKLTSASFKSIVDAIANATTLVSEIAVASNEQAKGVSQINIGLTQVDQVTQQNTANAAETASAVAELSSRANNLLKQINQFKLNEQNTRTHSVSTTPQLVALVPNFSPEADQGWNSMPNATVQNEAEINLDDDEFGKY